MTPTVAKVAGASAAALATAAATLNLITGHAYGAALVVALLLATYSPTDRS